MRQGQQHRRGRGRNNNNGNHNAGHSSHGQRKGQNPLTRSFESNGPDVKVRGTPAHVAEKYQQLARDAQSSGDHVLAENYLQHAEHYNRIIFAYREQVQQQSGELTNGNGRPHMGRHSGMEGDELGGLGGDDLSGPDDIGHGDMPMIVRNPAAEQPRTSDLHPGHDDIRPQRQSEPHPRFRDRPQRHERQDRPVRSERQEGYERGFERHRDRSYQDRSGEQPAEIREPREFREPREMREPRPVVREAGIADVPLSPAPAVAAEGSPPPARPEAAPRRRERFGLSPEHPDFLRRPVRRPRRDPEAGFNADAPPPPPPADDSTPD